MKSIAIITARGGSKRIPYKNIKEFFGKPVISYVISAILESKAFDTVMVSTDDEKIKEISLLYGASVPFMRSKKTSDDFAVTRDVLTEVLNNYKQMGINYDYMACFYPVNPFICVKNINRMMEMIKDDDCDSVETVTKYSFPPQRSVVIRNGYIKWYQPENALTRSQDLEYLYHDAGQMYAYKTSVFIEHNSFTEKKKAIIIPEYFVQDIDTIDDWKMAELKYEILLKQGLI